jgi:hypothetical protein
VLEAHRHHLLLNVYTVNEAEGIFTDRPDMLRSVLQDHDGETGDGSNLGEHHIDFHYVPVGAARDLDSIPIFVGTLTHDDES